MSTTTRKTATTTKVTALLDPNAPAKAPTTKPRYGFARVSTYDRVREPDLLDFADERVYWFTDHGMIVVEMRMLGTFRRYCSVRGCMIPPKHLWRFEGTTDESMEHLLQIVNVQR